MYRLLSFATTAAAATASAGFSVHDNHSPVLPCWSIHHAWLQVVGVWKCEPRAWKSADETEWRSGQEWQGCDVFRSRDLEKQAVGLPRSKTRGG